MSTHIVCGKCGGHVVLPAEYAKTKIRCTHCGYYAEIPPSTRVDDGAAEAGKEKKAARDKPRRAPKPTEATARRSVDPRDHRPQFEAEVPSGPPLLEGTTDEDDDRPYGVPGTGTKPCPHCQCSLPLNATVCVHCGRDLASGEKTVRRFEPINATFEESWPLDVRKKAFAVSMGVVLFVIVVQLVSGSNFSMGLFTLLVMTGMHAFIIGTFDTLNVKRTAKGQATLTRTRRIAFAPLAPEKLSWKESHATGMLSSQSPGIFAWMVCVYLLMLGIVPGIVFYWVFIRPDKYEVTVCDIHGGTDGIIFRSGSREQAEEVSNRVADATGLSRKPGL